MEAFVIGVNHRSASLELRGCMAFATQGSEDALLRLRARFPQQGFVLLSTCNRTELYGTLTHDGGSPRECLQVLLETRENSRQYSAQELTESLLEFTGLDAIRHLFLVTASLDSMLLGEDQILGQVKAAYEQAKQLDSINMFLEVLFRHAITAGKRVKSETGISRNSISLGTLAVKAAEQVLGDLRGQGALVVGSGKMGALAVRNLLQAGASPIYVTVRTKHSKRGSLVDDFPGVQTVDYDHRHDVIGSCAVIVSATQCPYFTLKSESVRALELPAKPRVFLDLAVPRDIEPSIAELPDCSYFDLDSLQMMAAENRELRKLEALLAEKIVDEELADLQCWWAHRKAMPNLRRLRVKARRRWVQAEQAMQKRIGKEPVDWGKEYSQLAGESLDVLFYRLREHCTPEELHVLYRVIDRAFRKW